MKKFFIGKKVGMTQLINDDGKVTPVTVLQARPCVVVDLHEVEGAVATVVLGIGEVKEKKLNKPRRGYFEKKGIVPKKYLKGFRVSNGLDYVVGTEITADIFNVDEKIKSPYEGDWMVGFRIFNGKDDYFRILDEKEALGL